MNEDIFSRFITRFQSVTFDDEFPLFLKHAKVITVFKTEEKLGKFNYIPVTEAAVWRCFVKKVFLKFLKIHRKTPLPESPFK